MSPRTDALRTELMALRNTKGLVNPAAVVAWARVNPQSHLHAALLWDDAAAAEQFRAWQVRKLIGMYIVDDAGEPAFVSLSIDRREGGYRPVSDVMGVAELREVMVADALAELAKVQARYERLTELSAVWVEAGRLRERRASQKKERAAAKAA